MDKDLSAVRGEHMADGFGVGGSPLHLQHHLSSSSILSLQGISSSSFTERPESRKLVRHELCRLLTSVGVILKHTGCLKMCFNQLV